MLDTSDLNSVELLLKTLAAAVALVAAVLGLVRARTTADLITSAILGSNLQPSVKEKIVAAFQSAKRLNQILLGAFVVIALLLVAVILLSPRPEDALSRYLNQHDPAIFYGSRNGQYRIARVLENQAELREETQLSKEIGDSKVSFDLLANTAGAIFRSHEPEFEEALKRGVNVRIILSDYSPANAQNFDVFALTVGEDPALVRADGAKVSAMVSDLARKAAADRAVYRGSLEIRWLAKPLFYTAWIRD